MPDADDPYYKSVLAVIRLVATALMLISLFLYSSDIYLYLSHKPVPGGALLFAKAVPFVMALALFWKSRSLAARFTEDID